ncbi:MAG: DUF58 domain-containing protein [Oleiphilaceae bacterium]|nr:DUF58 domain-containing protein [Oleiphilaceae bacterium]
MSFFSRSSSQPTGLSPRYWVRRWVHQRIPPSDEVTLNRRTIFVLPTREGMMFAGLLVICLLTGINYQNSLIYLFTFIMGTVFFGTILQTFQNLSNLRVTVVAMGEAQAGQPLPLTLRLVALDGTERPSVTLSMPDHEPVTVSVNGHQEDPVTLVVSTSRRGPVASPRVRIASDFPFGLIRTWSFLRPRRLGVATPRPVPAPEPASSASSDSDEPQGLSYVQGADETTLRGYREGDSLQRVQWKRFARTGQMVVADWEEPSGDPSRVSWHDYPGVDTELRLSYMADRVETLSRQQLPFALTLPDTELTADSGPEHRRECLRQLGLFGFTGHNHHD